jgi:hypothetical protein
MKGFKWAVRDLYISDLSSISSMIVCFFLAPDKNERGYINLLCFIVQVEMLKRQKDEVMIFHLGKYCCSDFSFL